MPKSWIEAFPAAAWIEAGIVYCTHWLFLQTLDPLCQSCPAVAAAQLQQGADFVLFDGFDVVFSLLGEFNKSATIDMKQLGKRERETFTSAGSYIFNYAEQFLLDKPTETFKI